MFLIEDPELARFSMALPFMGSYFMICLLLNIRKL
jgi:hypothetical protein